jgi:hypothetical protein
MKGIWLTNRSTLRQGMADLLRQPRIGDGWTWLS